MIKELEALEPSILLEFIDGLLKRYENKTDYNIYITKDWLLEIKQALKRLESIDNSNPSEALECLEKIIDNLDDYADFEIKQEANEYIATIKQALLKAEEPKQYLKWEDLVFKNYGQYIDVLLNGNKYSLTYYTDEGDIVWIYKEDKNILLLNGKYAEDKQFFNDLHLERVEE